MPLEDQDKQVNMEIPHESTRNGLVRCSKCQNPLNPGAKFCPHCGTPTSATLSARPDINETHSTPTPSPSLPIDSGEQMNHQEEAVAQHEKSLIDQGIQTLTRHCPYCGSILSASASFCGKCGRFLDPMDDTRDYKDQKPLEEETNITEQAPVESVLAVLPPATQRSGFMGMKAEGFVLVLTQTHILFAQQTSTLLKEKAQQARIAAKREGKGFFGQMGAQLGYYKVQRYLQMQPEEIMSETSGNFQIPNQQVSSIRLKRITDGDGVSSGVRMILRTDKSKLEYTFKNAGKKQIKKLLQITLGDLVR